MDTRHAITAAASADETVPPALVPARHAAFVAGEVVKVKRYGRGTVVAADADTVTVGFAGGSERCFQTEYVKRA